MGREEDAHLAEEVFAEYLLGKPSTSAFETLCHDHPHLEEPLRSLLAEWEEVSQALRSHGFGSSVETKDVVADAPPETLHVRPPGRYSVADEVGRGGMGVILRATDHEMHRDVAMKIIRGPDPGGETVLRRFLEEARVTARLDHPGVIPVYEMGKDEEGRAYFTMRLVRGSDFRSIISGIRKGEGSWTLVRGIRTLLQVCETVAYAHTRGVIHRDLKPANIMVGEFGETYLMDWGLACESTAAGEGTADSSPMGTPHYMPPEVCLGSTDELGPSTDVYSLGATLYHLLAGHAPYAEKGSPTSPVTLLLRVRNEAPVPLLQIRPDLPWELVAICEKAMSRHPETRYTGAMELADDLRAYLEARPISATTATPTYILRLALRRHRGLATTILLAAVVGMALVGWFLIRLKAERDVALDERNAKVAALTKARVAALADASGAARANPMRALLLARSAAEVSLRSEGEIRPAVTASLREALLALLERVRFDPGLEAVTVATATGDGSRFVVGTADGMLLAGNGEGEILFTKSLGDAITSAVLAPDGESILVGCRGGRILRWDWDGNSLAGWRSGEEARVLCSPHSELILVWVPGNSVGEVRNLQGGSVRRLYGISGITTAVAAPHREIFAIGGKNGTTTIWGAGSSPILTLRGHTREVNRVVFSADGSRMLTAAEDGTARLWETASGKMLRVLHHDGAVRGAAFSPDGSHLATSSYDRTARIWDANGDPVAACRGHEGEVYAVEFSPDGRSILTCSWDRTARTWDLSGQQGLVFQGHGKAVVSAVYLRNGTRVLTASRDGTARVWDTSRSEIGELAGHRGEVNLATFSPDGGLVLTCGEDGTARLWEPDGRGRTVLDGRSGAIRSVQFSPDGERVLTASVDGTARIWSLSGEEVLDLKGHGSKLMSAIYSKDGEMVVTASEDKTAGIWGLDGGMIRRLLGHRHWVSYAEFSPDRAAVLTASWDQTASIWDWQKGTRRVLKGHRAKVYAAHYSPDGKYVATCSDDETARIWLAETGEKVAVLEHGGPVLCVTFAPDGERLLTASFDRTVREWDLTGRETLRLPHEGRAFLARYSPSGNRILTVARGDTARLWDREGNELAVLQGHTREVTDAAFSPSGDRVVTASRDGRALLWLVEPKDLLALAEERITRDYTSDERKKYADLLRQSATTSE